MPFDPKRIPGYKTIPIFNTRCNTAISLLKAIPFPAVQQAAQALFEESVIAGYDFAVEELKARYPEFADKIDLSELPI
jgi:hypothetical protein